MTSIALNEMKDQAKKYNRQKKVLEEDVYHEFAVSLEAKSEFDSIEEKIEIQEKISLLNEKDREILILNYILDFPIEKIAQHFDITPNNASVRLKRAKSRLKTVFSQAQESERGELHVQPE